VLRCWRRSLATTKDTKSDINIKKRERERERGPRRNSIQDILPPDGGDGFRSCETFPSLFALLSVSLSDSSEIS
jgi:hypothetical protein